MENNFGKLGHETNQLLSQNAKLTFNTYKTRLGSMNTLVIGGTGEGKSRNYVRPLVYSLPCDTRDSKDLNGNVIHNPKMSFVFTDPKGELCRDTAGILKANGYKIKVVNLVDMENSDCYNPMKYVYYNTNPDTALTILIDGLVDTACGKDNKDPHWTSMAKNLLNCLAFYIHYELPAEMQNFTTMSNLVPLFALEEGETEAPIDKLLMNCKQFPLETHPALVWRRKISAQGGELSSIISTAQGALKLWADSSVQKLTGVDTLDLHTIGDEPTAVYIITPTTNSTYDFLVATFYNQMFESLMYKANMIYHGGLPHHVLVVQDEFANTGKIPDYDKKIATFRSCNISSIIIVQSTNQIKSMYEGKFQDILDNTHITIFLGNGGLDGSSDAASAASFISRALDKTTIKAEGTSLSYGNTAAGTLILNPNVSISQNASQRELMTAAEVRQLSATKCIIIIKGFKPILDDKIDLDKCLNYSSDIFTTADEKGQRKLRKEFFYDPQKMISTFDNYKIGCERCKELDELGSVNVRKRIVRESKFSSIGKEYMSEFVDSKNLMSFFEVANYIVDNCDDIIDRVGVNNDLVDIVLTKESEEEYQNILNYGDDYDNVEKTDNEESSTTENNDSDQDENIDNNSSDIQDIDEAIKEQKNDIIEGTDDVAVLHKIYAKKSESDRLEKDMIKAIDKGKELLQKINEGSVDPLNITEDTLFDV